MTRIIFPLLIVTDVVNFFSGCRLVYALSGSDNFVFRTV